MLLKGSIFMPPRIRKNANSLNVLFNYRKDAVVPLRECREDIELLRVDRGDQVDQAIFRPEKPLAQLMANDSNPLALFPIIWIKTGAAELPAVGKGRRRERSD
jgi:hypothetical protein